MDRRPDVEGGGAQCEFGSTHLAHPRLATAPDAPVQAVDRTQPGLPLKKDRAGSMTHDYERHGTTTLFAAMNVLDATVIGRNMQRHRPAFADVLVPMQGPAGAIVADFVEATGLDHRIDRRCATPIVRTSNDSRERGATSMKHVHDRKLLSEVRALHALSAFYVVP